MAWRLVILLGLLVAGCQPDAPPALPRSSWGPVITLAQAEQSSAPALWPEQARTAALWIGADETSIFQYSRAVTAAGLTGPHPLALVPAFPDGQYLLPASNGYYHLLWLDADHANHEAGPRLWTALLTPDLRAERGAIQVSNQRTQHYAVAPAGDGGLWTVWSGEPLAEPRLYIQYIDSAGRPRASHHLAYAADWPALIRAGGVLNLFWRRSSGHQIYRASLDGEMLQNAVPVTTMPPLQRGDRLMTFNAGADATHAYLFWNITRADGQAEVWMSSSPLGDDMWGAPIRLGIDVLGDSIVQTGFNGGPAQTTGLGERWLRWLMPLADQSAMLPAAAQVENALVVVYFQGGAVSAAQEVVTLSYALIGSPGLYADRDRHLYLAWAEPQPAGFAHLNLTSTRWLIPFNQAE